MGIIIIAICFNDCQLLFLGDWHTAYLLLYGPRKLQKPPQEEEKKDEGEKKAEADKPAESMETS